MTAILMLFRCKIMDKSRYHCGPFDFDGFATDNEVYPIPWKASMFFISLGFFILTTTVLLTLLTCCRQSLFGKSIHNITGSAQVVSGVYCFWKRCGGHRTKVFYYLSRNTGDVCCISSSHRMGSEESRCNVRSWFRIFLSSWMFDR